MLDFTIKLINDPQGLTSWLAQLDAVPALALDIETVNWWDRRAERVSLIQLAFREGRQLRVAVIDVLDGLDLDPLRPCLERVATMKAVHNAAYDAVRLSHHFRIHTAPIHDTMLAARRGGEKHYSLKSQAQAHLGMQLDKSEQRSDWSRRPLTLKQLRYAGVDVACTLLLYEDQLGRGVSASYQLRESAQHPQTSLPLSAVSRPVPGVAETPKAADSEARSAVRLPAPTIALLGVITELAGVYSPDRLAVSVGSDRVGLAGWIIDRTLGADTDLDEDTAKVGIAELCERGLIRFDAEQRLEATEAGARLWRRLKPS